AAAPLAPEGEAPRRRQHRGGSRFPGSGRRWRQPSARAEAVPAARAAGGPQEPHDPEADDRGSALRLQRRGLQQCDRGPCLQIAAGAAGRRRRHQDRDAPGYRLPPGRRQESMTVTDPPYLDPEGTFLFRLTQDRLGLTALASGLWTVAPEETQSRL